MRSLCICLIFGLFLSSVAQIVYTHSGTHVPNNTHTHTNMIKFIIDSQIDVIAPPSFAHTHIHTHAYAPTNTCTYQYTDRFAA